MATLSWVSTRQRREKGCSHDHLLGFYTIQSGSVMLFWRNHGPWRRTLPKHTTQASCQFPERQQAAGISENESLLSPPHSNTNALTNTVYQSHLSACTSLTAGPNNSHTCNYEIPLVWYKPQPLFPFTQLWLTKTASNILYNQHIPMYSVQRHSTWSPVSLTCTSHRYVCLTKAVGHAISQAVSCQPLNKDMLSG